MAVDTVELRELLSKATKGLWRKGKPFWTCDPTADPPVCRQHYRLWIDCDHEIWVDRGWDQGYSEVPDTHADMIAGAFGHDELEYGIVHEEDQDLICAAVNALPDLLADRTAMEAEIAALREWKEQASPALKVAREKIIQLELQQHRVDEDNFEALWFAYAKARDEELTEDARDLKGRLRAIVGVDKLEAALQRAQEALAKMRERAKPPEGVEWSHQTDAYRDCADILKEALGDEDRVQRPPIICLCGSTRFMDAFFEAGWQATLAGKIVLSVGVCKHVDTEGGHGGEMLGPETVAALDELHLRKIDLADQVLILNVGGYIGESTGRELAYARSIGKSVRFLEPPEEEALGDET